MSRIQLPLCPRCGDKPLVRHTVATGGIAHQCTDCHGTQMLLSVLRSRSGDSLVPRLWAEASAHPRPGIACPLCRRSSLALLTDGVELDLCRACQSLWFDADELDRFPIRGAPTRQQTTVDTAKYQPPNRRPDPTTKEGGTVVEDVVDAVFDILTNWD